jgi:hypothetical protein
LKTRSRIGNIIKKRYSKYLHAVAILMGGGPSVIYGAEALDALDQFEAKGGAIGPS